MKMKIDLAGSMAMLIVLMALFGVYKMVSMIYLLIVGATANVALSGDITVPDGINNTTQDVVTSVSTGYTAFISADAIILGLIGLVVILKLFWPLIAMYLPSKGKKKKSFN